jgi:hypothetical protein
MRNVKTSFALLSSLSEEKRLFALVQEARKHGIPWKYFKREFDYWQRVEDSKRLESKPCGEFLATGLGVAK